MSEISEIIKFYEENQYIDFTDLIYNQDFVIKNVDSLLIKLIERSNDILAMIEINNFDFEQLKKGGIDIDKYTETTRACITKLYNIIKNHQNQLKNIMPYILFLTKSTEKIKNNDIHVPIFREHPQSINQINTDDEIKCFRGNCKFCIEEYDRHVLLGNNEYNKSFKFCFDKCSWCNTIRKESKKKTVDKELEKYIEKDRFFDVFLESNPEDGSPEYIKLELEKNFKRMFPPSHPANAWIYSLEDKSDGSVNLYGLIRYDENSKHRISPKSPNIKNVIIGEKSREKNNRPHAVLSLTLYRGKKIYY